MHQQIPTQPQSLVQAAAPPAPDLAPRSILPATAGPRPACSARWSLALLCFVLLLAGTLRFDGIMRTAIRFDDESWYVSDARLWHRCARVLADARTLRALLRGQTAVIHEHMVELGVDFNHRYRKPCVGYTFLGAASMFIVGDRPAALLVTSAICGTLAVWLLYLFASRLFGRSVALAAAFLLAVSPYHLIYSRSALTDATAGMFILAGSLFWVLGRQNRWPWRRCYLLTGAALGYAITCHYRCAIFPVLLMLTDYFFFQDSQAVQDRSQRSVVAINFGGSGLRPRRLHRLLYLAVGVLIPLLAFEGLFLSGRLVASSVDGFFPVPTFLEALWDYSKLLSGRLRIEGGAVWNPDVLSAYTAYLAHWHGSAATVLLALGLFVAVFHRGAAQWPVILILSSLCILTLQRYTVARAVSPVLPFICLCTALAIHALVTWLGRSKQRRPVWALSATLAVSAPAVDHSWTLKGKRGCTEMACEFLMAQGDGGVALPMDTRKYSLYLEQTAVRWVPVEKSRVSDSPAEVLEHLKDAGVRWMVTDPQHWHCRRLTPPDYGVFAWWEAMEAELQRSVQLVAEFPHVLHAEWEFLSEGWGLTFLEEMIDRRGGCIRIYDLQRRAEFASPSPQSANRGPPVRPRPQQLQGPAQGGLLLPAGSIHRSLQSDVGHLGYGDLGSCGIP